jgi:hypothetical protein
MQSSTFVPCAENNAKLTPNPSHVAPSGNGFHNHADGIAAMDFFVVPTISFRLLYGLLIVGHGRR